MGAKAAFAVIGDLWEALSNGAEPDRDAAEAVIRALRPDCAVEPAADGTLADVLYPPPQHAYVAVLPEATIVCDQLIEDAAVLEHAAGRPVVVFEQTPDSFRFTEWSADGTEVRYEDEEDLADDLAEEVFGLTAESVREELVMQGFLVTPQNQAEIDAAFDAAWSAASLEMAADRSLVPRDQRAQP
jgi:hypothetical protein